MYHRGGDRGWQHGHHHMDVPASPSRSHRSRPYRGGYHDHREQDSYGSYHDNQCHDRNYDENQYVEYQERSYQQSFSEYREREQREPVYNRGSRHDGGYHKETYYQRGSYQRGQGEHVRYRGHASETPHKKYSYKPVKVYKKENAFRVQTSPPQHAGKVHHDPGPIIVTLTPGITEDTSEEKHNKAESPEQYDKPSQDYEKPSQETTKLESIKTDDVETASVGILTLPSNQINETLPVPKIKTEVTEFKKEDPLQTVQDEKPQTSVNPGKRAVSEEKDFDFNVDQRNGEPFAGKRLCRSHDEDENIVQIPLLGGLGDMPSETVESASTSDHENTGSTVNCDLPEAAQELRTAFILAKKEQIEVAFAQDCKTFALVASTLLKKDPSIKAAVTSALRSSLQEMAGLSVQELNNFIDQYDSRV